MKIEFFRGRRWLATASMVAALSVTGFYGLRAAEQGKLPFQGPTPTVKIAARSEAASGRGYSAVVKRVVPAVVNISSSKMVKQTAMETPEGWIHFSGSSSETTSDKNSTFPRNAVRRLLDRVSSSAPKAMF